MKEISAIVRMNKVSETSEELKKHGFPCFTCRRVMGRGKRKVDFVAFNKEALLKDKPLGEEISERHRLIPKRMFTIVVNDENVDEVIDIIIRTNQTKNPGDGKIFVRDITETIRIRTGEKNSLAL